MLPNASFITYFNGVESTKLIPVQSAQPLVFKQIIIGINKDDFNSTIAQLLNERLNTIVFFNLNN
jgi:hypothetical protein